MERSYLIKPFLDRSYPTAVRGHGIYIFDEQGKRYLDGSSGAVTASLGHAVPDIVETMHKQAQNVSFVYRSQFTSKPAEELAKKLNELAFGGDQHYWSFFVNSGSEATETAMKVAIQHWQEKGKPEKKKIISRWSSYHGITMGALSMSGHPERRKRFVHLLEDYPAVAAPYCYRCPFNQTFPACNLLCAQDLERAINRLGAENVAAFIAEPIVGAAGGVIVPPDGYYQQIKKICEENDILFIADEVLTGIGRTGKMFAMEHWGAAPDIITLGKGMTAGYTPMAAAMVSEKVLEPIMNGSASIMSGHTFSANPQSAAVSLAVLEFIEKHNLVNETAQKGDYLMKKLQEMAAKYRIIGDVRGKGLLFGIEFISDVFTKRPFSKETRLTEYVIDRAKENGLLVYPAAAGYEGDDGDAVIISPPLTINKQEIDQLVRLFEKTIYEVQTHLEKLGLINYAG